MRGQPGHIYTTTRLIATQITRHGCMDDLTTESSTDSQATWVVDVLGLCCPRVFVQPGTGIRPVDRCRN